MEILAYTQEHEAFRKRLAEFLAAEVVPLIPRFEEERMVGKDVWRKMGRAGFLCPALSRDYGGPGGDFLHSVIVIEELSRSGISGFATPLHSDIVVPYIEAYGSEEQKRAWLPGCADGSVVTAVAMTEPGAGSDLASMTTTDVETNGQVSLSGAKTFISNGIIADLVIVAARDPEVKNPHEAISLYLVQDGTPGLSRGRKLDKMGLQTQDTAELFFTNCRIPAENRLGMKGGGFLMLMQKLQQERLVVALMAVCAMDRIVSWITDYCKSTKVNGRALSRGQAVSFALVEMATEAKIARTFVEKLVADHMEKKQVVVETSMAKYWASDAATRLAGRALDLMGPEAVLDCHPMARAFRDVRVMSIFAGANEIMKMIAGRFMGL
ncbi:MAG: acyl-CoA dehydrogenase family protein [Thermodesulfobacteriota bacterium]